jgi:hypothetical protein
VRDEEELRFADMSRTIAQNRSVFGSSSGASTSSRRQNGAGLIWNSANTSEIAVSAFSPPDEQVDRRVALAGAARRPARPSRGSPRR